VDVEISFATRDLVFSVIEPLMQEVFREVGQELALPLRRMPYSEAIARYGSDKPDLRFGMAIEDLSDAFRQAPFGPFRDALGAGGVVRGFAVTGEPATPAETWTSSRSRPARRGCRHWCGRG